MKRVALWGAGEFGQYVLNRLQENSEYKIKYFVDTNAKKIKRQIPVLTVEEMINKVKNNEIDFVLITIANEKYLLEVARKCDNILVTSKILSPMLFDKKSQIITDDVLTKHMFENKAFLSLIEYHVCDNCNLNCVGCAHFAPIFKDSFSDIAEFKKDISQLSKVFNVFNIRLMGGEPLLHSKVTEFINLTRKYFPKTILQLVTNGLLLYKMDEEFWRVIKDNEVELHISLYEPVYKIKDKLQKLLNEKKVNYSFDIVNNEKGFITEFHKVLTSEKKYNPQLSVANCFGRNCHYFRDGKISKCAVPLLVPYINKYFKTKFDVTDDDFINIYDKNISAWDMAEKLYQPTPFCAYCIEKKPQRFLWECQKKNIVIDDYVVNTEL